MTQTTVELTDIADLPKDEVEASISRHWPGEPHYRGQNVFEHVYGYGPVHRVRPGIEAAVQATGLLPDDYQESYLGYLPSQDAFVIGFDVWEEDEDECGCTPGWRDEPQGKDGVFFVKIHADGTMGCVSVVPGMLCETFYSGNYQKLRADYPDIIDIRLD